MNDMAGGASDPTASDGPRARTCVYGWWRLGLNRAAAPRTGRKPRADADCASQAAGACGGPCAPPDADRWRD